MSQHPLSQHFADRLLAAIREKKSVVCVGLDPMPEYFPPALAPRSQDSREVLDLVFRFCQDVIRTVAPHAACVKLQSAYFEVFHAEDPTRPVTQALFRPNVSKDYDNGLADMLDVVGQNYRENEILAAATQKPSRKIVGTETTHDRKDCPPTRNPKLTHKPPRLSPLLYP